MTAKMSTALQLVRDAIDSAAASDDGAAVVAERVVTTLRRTHPEALAEYLDAMAVVTVARAVRTIDSSTRSRARWQAERSVFANDPQSWLDARYAIGAKRLRLAEMTRADLTVVAGRLRSTASTLDFEADFITALADQLGEDKTVEQVLTDQEIRAIRTSLAST